MPPVPLAMLQSGGHPYVGVSPCHASICIQYLVPPVAWKGEGSVNA
ncbi:MAG: hypothetical protein L6Q35_06290 [Phycisphaerales bacterium]|nr:hypothetical protein [Phycisphaerales bacterium]